MPVSQFLELSNCPWFDEMFVNAPAAMYFVISVLPISMTSGVSLPAIVASNFCKWVVHCWYWTSTFQPGFAFSNLLFAAATISGQPFWASTWSHTVSVWPAALLLGAVVATTAESAIAAATTARIRYLMLNLPRDVDARAGRPRCLWPGSERCPAVRRVVYTNRPRAESPTPDHSCQGSGVGAVTRASARRPSGSDRRGRSSGRTRVSDRSHRGSCARRGR